MDRAHHATDRVRRLTQVVFVVDHAEEHPSQRGPVAVRRVQGQAQLYVERASVEASRRHRQVAAAMVRTLSQLLVLL